MKDQILQLHAEGYSYREICKRVGCTKGTVSYHCGKGQKEKSKRRCQERRKAAVISKRVENFQYKRGLKDKAEDFQRDRVMRNGQMKLGQRTMTFTWREVIEKYGWETTCYLTGRPIDMREPGTYQFDHVVPYSRDGSRELENLGIACKAANQAKADMTVDEFLVLCKEVLENHGYKVTKGSDPAG